MHYLSRKPSFDKVEGFADITFGLYDSDADALSASAVEGAVGGPFSDRVAGRVAAFMYSEHDGYLNNLYPAQAPGRPGRRLARRGRRRGHGR